MDETQAKDYAEDEQESRFVDAAELAIDNLNKLEVKLESAEGVSREDVLVIVQSVRGFVSALLSFTGAADDDDDDHEDRIDAMALGVTTSQPIPEFSPELPGAGDPVRDTSGLETDVIVEGKGVDSIGSIGSTGSTEVGEGVGESQSQELDPSDENNPNYQ